MPQKTKPDQKILEFQKEEQRKFWELHPGLLNEIRNSYKAIGKPVPASIQERGFLEFFYGGENGHYGKDWPAVITGNVVYFPEKNYRDLLRFLLSKHNAVVQSVRDDAESTRLYKEWLKNYSPLGEISETIKNAAIFAGVLILGYMVIK